MDSPGDTQLMERWRTERDGEALATVMARHAGLVYATCRRILRDAAEAEDVTQECFLELASARKAPPPILAPWLHRMATYRALDRLRSRKRRERREQAYGTAMPRRIEPTWDDVSARVDEAIAALPQDLRIPLVRHFLEGHSYAALARLMNVPKSTLARRVQEGLEIVRETLKRQGIGVGGATLATMLSKNAAEAVPQTLMSQLGRMAVAGGGKSAAVATGLGGTVIMGKKSILTAVGILAVLSALVATPAALRHMGRDGTSEVVAPAGEVASTQTGAGGTPSTDRARPAASRQEMSLAETQQLLAALLTQFAREKQSEASANELKPLSSDDLPPENGMHYFLLAAELLPEIDRAWLGERLKLIEANGWVDDPKLVELLEACGDSFNAVRTGLEVGNAMLPPLRGFAEPMTYVSQWRTLARLMALQGTMYAAHGDYAAAFDDFATLLEFANESRRGGAIIGGLAGTAISNTAAQALHGELPRSQASPDDYRNLLSRLEALQADQYTMAQSVQSEVETFENWIAHAFGADEQLRDLLTNPDAGLPRDAQRWATTAASEELHGLMEDMLQTYRDIVPYFELPYYDAQNVDLGSIVGDNPVMRIIVEPLEGLPLQEARVQAHTGAAAVQAAIELYRIEHGRYPDSLEALVPDVLTEVPQDPFTGEPLAYAAGAEGYLLYSAGADMQDNGGTVDDYDEPGGDLMFHRP